LLQFIKNKYCTQKAYLPDIKKLFFFLMVKQGTKSFIPQNIIVLPKHMKKHFKKTISYLKI